MLTDNCKAVIDEVLSANGDLSKLSVETSAHLENCLECRRSLESIKALKASAASVIPAASLALKAKIASNLEGALQARKAAASTSAISKETIIKGSLAAAIGLAGLLTIGFLLSDNKSEITDKTSLNKGSEISQPAAGNSLKTESASSIEINNNKTDKEDILKRGYNSEDMRSHEQIQYPTQNIPSSRKDSDY